MIRSGLEVLSGKDPMTAFRLPSALDPLAAAAAAATNPAFRQPFGSGLIPGLPVPPTSVASAVCRDPYCRDITCPTAVYNAQLAAAFAAAGGGLPPGYAEMLKYAQTSAAASSTSPATTTTPSTSSNSNSSTAGGPYICNWMNGREGYCGKRHNSAEELLQHLRTHTNLSTSDSALLSSTPPTPPAPYPPMFGSAAAAAAAGMHRTFGLGSSLLSSNRFHPYAAAAAAAAAGKSGMGSALPPSLGLGLGLPPSAAAAAAAAAAPAPAAAAAAAAGFPPSLAALGGFSPSSLYALYGSRLTGGTLP